MTGSVLLFLSLFTGCGESVSSDTALNQPRDTTKLIRAAAEETDWTWFVGTDGVRSGANLTLDVYFTHNIPAEVEHFQYFLDTDNNANTGFSFGQDSWRISGADYLIEDGHLYKSTSNTNWSWTYVRDINTYSKNVEGNIAHIQIKTNSNIVTGNTLNITIEPFDANWGSTYSTISTQAVPLGDGGGGENSDAKIFIIGDSTVHNDSEGEMGWGSKLSTYMKHPNNAFNRARSGSSSKTYKYDSASHHDWSTTKTMMQNTDTLHGAYLFIQFGHNDEKQGYTYTQPGRHNSYYNELEAYVDQAKDLGFTPVLITPVSRQYVGSRTHGQYPQTMKDLASDKGVLLLDLEYKSYVEFKKYPSDSALQKAFGYDDGTHFSPTGAGIVAGWVKELACQKDQALCGQF